MTDVGSVLDFGNMMAPRLGGRGLASDSLTRALADRFRAAHEEVGAAEGRGELGFARLPYAAEEARGVQEVADSFGQWFEDLLVLGIGGSALGARTLKDALLGPGWNRKSDEEREYFPRLHVLDNVDPHTISQLLRRLDLRRTLINVVSKSGSTAETMAQYLVLREGVLKVVDEENVAAHFLFTTDSERGALRHIAEAEGIPTLAIPENVGGRFSVLSAAGLLPAAVCGVDLPSLLAGAAHMQERCRGPELLENPAGVLSTLLHAADVELGAHIHVLMPYSDRLRSFALWFQQLWAESLGKVGETEAGPSGVGPTPLPAVGATDQHSQVQLFMEGPLDKAVVFLGLRDHGDPVPIPALHGDVEELAYLGGHTLAELMRAEREATAEALRQAGRPSMTLLLDRLDARSLGEMFLLCEWATVYAGALYGVDAMVQPGVELGKRLTYGLMGRKGFSGPASEPDESGNEPHPWRV